MVRRFNMLCWVALSAILLAEAWPYINAFHHWAFIILTVTYIIVYMVESKD